MKRLLTVLTILAIFQFACGTATPSLWGTYATPTSAPPTIPSTARPSRTPLPTASATITLTPSITPTAISSFITPTRNAAGVDEPNPTPRNTSAAPILYYTQSGDTLAGVARRFDVEVSEITATVPLPESIKLIDPGTLLVIPEHAMDKLTPNEQILPDSEVVYTASALDFDTDAYLDSTDGYLKNYREYLGSTGWVTGPKAIRRLADENSINPRLLLAVLEYESRWVRGQPVDALHAEYPMGYEDFRYKSMFTQMVWAINQLSIGYYGWRNGTLTELDFPDGTRLRLDPRLNAGTVAVQYLFSRLHSQSQWAQIINLETGFPALYEDMFGDPWARGDMVNPIFPPGLTQPAFGLPFDPRVEWSYTGGPHGAWEHDGAMAAIDFAPATDHGGCAVTDAWVTASAPGLVVRSEYGVVVVDLDGDGYEQTGWTLLYLHIATTDRVRKGEWVDANDHIGHPSCEGGISTGTHLHFARKYNGEWVTADGPIPFVLDGWKVIAGQKPYEGLLVRGDKTIIADPVGQAWSIIFREPNVTPTPVGP